MMTETSIKTTNYNKKARNFSGDFPIHVKRIIAIERGIAVLEGAIWLVMIVPVALLGALVAGIVHDRSVVEAIPSDLLREVTVRSMSWREGNTGNHFAVDEVALKAMLEPLSEQARRRIKAETFTLAKVSAKACYWIYSVDEISGHALKQTSQGCNEGSNKSATLDLTSRLNSTLTGTVGIPLYGQNDSAHFVNVVVLVGLEVSGTIDSFGLSLPNKSIGGGKVLFPRQELKL